MNSSHGLRGKLKDKAGSGLLSQDLVVVLVQLEVVFVDVLLEVVCPQDLGYFDELIVVVASLEEGFFLKDDAGEHGAGAEDVEGVVVIEVVHEEFRSFEVPGSHADIVVLAIVVEFCKTPVDELECPGAGLDDDVLWLHVAVHDAFGVAVVQGLQELVHVVADFVVLDLWEHALEVDVLEVVEDLTIREGVAYQGGGLGDWVPDDILDVDDVWASLQNLQDFDFTPDLLLPHRLEHLHDHVAVVAVVECLENLGVLASPDLLDQFVIVLASTNCGHIVLLPFGLVVLVVPVLPRHFGVGVRVVLRHGQMALLLLLLLLHKLKINYQHINQIWKPNKTNSHPSPTSKPSLPRSPRTTSSSSTRSPSRESNSTRSKQPSTRHRRPESTSTSTPTPPEQGRPSRISTSTTKTSPSGIERSSSSSETPSSTEKSGTPSTSSKWQVTPNPFHPYLLDVRKKVIIERNQIKKKDKQTRNSQSHQVTQSFQNSIILQQSFYKSPTEVINSWIEERAQLSSKYREKYQQMKVQEMVDTVKYFESMKKLDCERQQFSDRKKALKQSVNDMKLQKAQTFNSKIDKLKAKREEKSSDELEKTIQKRKEYENKNRQRIIDMEEIQARMERYNQKQKQVVDKKNELESKYEKRINIKDIENEMNQSFMKRQKNLNEKSLQMTMSLKQLPSIQQRCSENDFNKKQSYLKNHMVKMEKFEQSSEKLEENLKKSIIKKQNTSKQKKEGVSRNQQRLIENLDKRVNSIQERLMKEEQNVIENEDEKYQELMNKVEENRERMKKNLTKNSQILSNLREKSDIKLQYEQNKYKQNVGLLKKREWAIEKMKHERMISLNKIDSLDLEKIRKEVSCKL